MSSSKGNAVIGQSGGPTSVINQSLVGVVETLLKSGHVGQILGARHGVSGIVKGEFIPLDRAPVELLERVAKTPAAALGSTRDKPDAAYCEKIFDSFKKHDVRYFFYLGGNDSADTARIVDDLARSAKYELKTYHVPKTIDNDLRVHDHTPGFGSAAKFVAAATMGDNFDNRSLPGVKVNVIMGRHAGYLTAASALARQNAEDGPHLIYVPEAAVSEEKMLADIDVVFKKRGRCLISISEGVSTADGKTWSEKILAGSERDSHGNLQLSGSGALGDYVADLVKKKLGIKRVRSDTFGYLQRSFPGFVSEVDASEARRVGRDAATASVKEAGGVSVAMRRVAGASYAIETFLTPLSTVARETKHVPAEFLQGGNDVTAAFLDYCRPLVGGLPEVGNLDSVK